MNNNRFFQNIGLHVVNTKDPHNIMIQLVFLHICLPHSPEPIFFVGLLKFSTQQVCNGHLVNLILCKPDCERPAANSQALCLRRQTHQSMPLDISCSRGLSNMGVHEKQSMPKTKGSTGSHGITMVSPVECYFQQKLEWESEDKKYPTSQVQVVPSAWLQLVLKRYLLPERTNKFMNTYEDTQGYYKTEFHFF